MRRHLFLAPLFAAVCAARLALTPSADGCAPVMFKGQQVAIASESALIIYDEKTQTEHFIRRGTFETKAPYFGFLVPTPTQPELAEAPDDLFSTMEDWTKPEVITKTVKRPRNWLAGVKVTRQMVAGNAPMADEAVQVVGVQQVGDYKATILKASDASKLREWLNEHNYDAPPSLDKWLGHYVKAGWYLTAFQMSKPDPNKPSNLKSKAVRMSFKTDRPFYPYMEPESQREPGAFKPSRLLRVFYVGTQRVAGQIDHPSTPWQANAVWSNTIGDDQRDKLLEKLKGQSLATPQKMWLTVFEDHASPRPGVADLFFAPSANQSTIARPPIIQYNYV